jgi:hypothetical protein
LIIAIAIIAFASEQVINSDDKAWKQWLTSTVTLVIVPLSIFSSLSNELIFESHAFQSLIVTGLVLALNIFSSNSTGAKNFSRPLSMLGFAVAAIIALFNIVEIIQLSNWVIVGVIGGAFIVGASFYERYGLRLNSSKNLIDG